MCWSLLWTIVGAVAQVAGIGLAVYAIVGTSREQGAGLEAYRAALNAGQSRARAVRARTAVLWRRATGRPRPVRVAQAGTAGAIGFAGSATVRITPAPVNPGAPLAEQVADLALQVQRLWKERDDLDDRLRAEVATRETQAQEHARQLADTEARGCGGRWRPPSPAAFRWR